MQVVATAQGALQIASVKMAKPKLAGGIVLPRAGGRDVTLAENGYAEMALNAGPSGQEMMGPFRTANRGQDAGRKRAEPHG